MEKVRPWCGQPSERGRLKNRTEQVIGWSSKGHTAKPMNLSQSLIDHWPRVMLNHTTFLYVRQSLTRRVTVTMSPTSSQSKWKCKPIVFTLRRSSDIGGSKPFSCYEYLPVTRLISSKTRPYALKVIHDRKGSWPAVYPAKLQVDCISK